MIFDADEYLAGFEPPRIKLGGEEYVGQILSYEEFLPFQIKMLQLQSGILQGKALINVVLDYCDAVFGGPPWWKFWKPSVGRLVLQLPPKAMLEAVNSFLARQAEAMGIDLSPAEEEEGEGEPQQET